MKLRRAYYTHPIVANALQPIAAWRRRIRTNQVSAKSIDETIERLFVEAPLVRIPEFEGEFRVRPKSDLLRRLVRTGSYEPETAALARRLIDRTRDVIDIGANVGFFSILAARLTSGSVLAAEPVPSVLALLQHNIRHNEQTSHVRIFNGVITDEPGTVVLQVVEDHEEYSSILKIAHPCATNRQTTQIAVNALNVDSLVVAEKLNPGFMKIDVEGAEHKVLAGAKRTLNTSRPVLLSEFSPKLMASNSVDPSLVLSQLGSSGYRLFDPAVPGLPAGRRPLGDLLAVPEELYTEREILDILYSIHP